MFLDKIEKRSLQNETDWTAFIKGEDENDTDALKENTYFTALNRFANSIAKLPISIKRETDKGDVEATELYLWDLIKYRPNPNMNPFDCFKAFIMQYKHSGISGLYIDRNKSGKVEGLYPVSIDNIIIDNIGLIKSKKENKALIDFNCIGATGSCFEEDIIILRDNSLDGIYGKSTKRYIRNALTTNLKAQEYQNDLFSNGLTNKVVVQMVSDIKDGKELKKTQERFGRLYSSTGRVFTVPAGFTVQPLNLSLADSQFSELKIIGKKDISSAIGVPYSLVDKGVLTQEETIGYLETTISPIIAALESEMTYKLLGESRKDGYKVKVNTNAMLRINPKTQQEIICQYTRNGIYSLEYAREILGVASDFENETVTLPSGQILLKDLISGKATWQKGGEKNGQGN